MRAVTCHEGRLEVADVPDPTPGQRQVLLAVTRAGICGSDLHLRTDGDASADVAAEVGYDAFMRSGDVVVLGHEFTGSVAGYGPGCRRRWPEGAPVVSMPLLRQGSETHLIGMTRHAPGAFTEYVVVSEDVTMPVPAGVAPEPAALTEPLAVARRAVRRSGIGSRDVGVVIGCGPVGLLVILALKAAGVRTVVAADLSTARRDLARRCGADVVVDPAEDSPLGGPLDAVGRRPVRTATELYGAAIDAMHTLQAVPGLPWWQVIRAATRLRPPAAPVVFECVGVPGVLESIVTQAPFQSRVMVVGVCMPPDSFRPAMALNKELEVRFTFGYDPADFHDALHLLGSGAVDPSPLVTATVGLAGVPAAFELLASAPVHAKILVDPQSSALPG